MPLGRPLAPSRGAGTLLLLFVACSAPPRRGPSSVLTTGEQLDCAAPVGRIPREDCTAIAEDFGALSLSGALQIAGTARGSELRIEAIRAAAALSNALKEQRVALCEEYNKCKVRPADHAAKDERLASAMRSLIDLWNKRQFSRTEEVVRFREGVRAIEQRVSGQEVRASAPKSLRAEDALAPVEGAGFTFKRDKGALIVTAKASADRPVLRSVPAALQLSAGHHYRVRVTGSYTPSEPALIQPGDSITARLKFHAREGSELSLALRSLDDPDATESTQTFPVQAGETAAREASFTADPQASGFYLGVGVHGKGGVDLDDIEIVRQGKVLAAARAEAASEAYVQTDCSPVADKPLAGAKSLRCQQGDGDRVTLGMPASFLSLKLRTPDGDKAVVRTLSLQGGRSVDATLREDGVFVVSLSGAGSVTINAIELSELVY